MHVGMPAGIIVGELAGRARDGPGFDLPVVPLDEADEIISSPRRIG